MGTLLQDRLTCIEGELGAAPEMLPVTVSLDSPSGNRRFSFEVVQDDALTPILVGLSVQASLQRILEYSAESTLRAEIRVESEQHPTLNYSLIESDTGGVQSRRRRGGREFDPAERDLWQPVSKPAGEIRQHRSSCLGPHGAGELKSPALPRSTPGMN
jgi:hypothetical protein